MTGQNTRNIDVNCVEKNTIFLCVLEEVMFKS
jgi:hypothetical protein